MGGKPFRILGIQQIAIGGADTQRQKNLWVDMLGVAVKSTFVSERENVDEDIGQLGQGPTAVEVDLMQPLDAGPQTGGAQHALEPCRSVGRSPGSIAWAKPWRG